MAKASSLGICGEKTLADRTLLPRVSDDTGLRNSVPSLAHAQFLRPTWALRRKESPAAWSGKRGPAAATIQYSGQASRRNSALLGRERTVAARVSWSKRLLASQRQVGSSRKDEGASFGGTSASWLRHLLSSAAAPYFTSTGATVARLV